MNSDVETSQAERTDMPLAEDVVRLQQIQSALEIGNRDVTEMNNLDPSVDPPELHQDEAHVGALLGDRYESALHGLIALGTGNTAGSRTATAAERDKFARIEDALTVSTMSDDAPSVLPNVDEQTALNLDPGALIGARSESFSRDSLSADRTLELLSHFRYEIAPWVSRPVPTESSMSYLSNAYQLDICDMAQSFGVALPRVAMRSDSVRFAVLALASSSTRVLASHNASWCDRESRDLVSLSEACQNHDQPFESSVSAVLRTLWYFLSDIPRAWEQGPFHEVGLMDMIAAAQGHGRMDMLSSLYWLLLRLGK
jgi:hypothetical protein